MVKEVGEVWTSWIVLFCCGGWDSYRRVASRLTVNVRIYRKLGHYPERRTDEVSVHTDLLAASKEDEEVWTT